MKSCYRGIIGSVKLDGNDVSLRCLFSKEKCTVQDIVGIGFQPLSLLTPGCIQIWTNKKIQEDKSSCLIPFYREKRELVLGQFYQSLLGELRRCHGSKGFFSNGCWFWL